MFTELLKKSLKNIPTPEPKIPKNCFINSNFEDDESELSNNEEIEDEISSAVFISYKNSKNEISNRRITIKTVKRSSNGDIVIGAYCFERKALRTFRADRIIEAIDIETGEVLDNQEKIFEAFGILEKENISILFTPTIEALKKYRHQLNVLIYLARCDGHFHYAEEEIIVHYLMDVCFDCNFNDEYLLKRLRRYYPDGETFYNSLDYLQNKAIPELDKVARYSAQLIQADGEITKVETNFMTEIQAYAA